MCNTAEATRISHVYVQMPNNAEYSYILTFQLAPGKDAVVS